MKSRTYTAEFSTPEDKPHGILSVINQEGTAESTFPVTQEAARLALAAPELLSQLKAALSVVEECDPDTVRMYAPSIRAAIAKAEGRTA